MDVTVYKLKDEINEAALRLIFLLDHVVMPSEKRFFLCIKLPCSIECMNKQLPIAVSQDLSFSAGYQSIKTWLSLPFIDALYNRQRL